MDRDKSYLPLSTSDPPQPSAPPWTHRFTSRSSPRRLLLWILLSCFAISYFSRSSSLRSSLLGGVLPSDPACRGIDCDEAILTASLVKPLVDDPTAPPPQGWRRFTPGPSASSALHRPRPLQRTLAERIIPPRCADDWVSSGTITPSCRTLISRLPVPPPDLRIDAVWTWVDGADAVLAPVRTFALAHPDDTHRWDQNDDDDVEKWTRTATLPPSRNRRPPPAPIRPGGAPRHFREHDELRYSLRAAVAGLGAERLRKLQIVTADVALDLPPESSNGSAEVEARRERLGQVPHWLDLSPSVAQGTDGRPGVVVRHHFEAFKAPKAWLEDLAHSKKMSNNKAAKEASTWRDHVVPSFTSLGIESQMPHLEDLGETLWYFNDDVFALRNLTRGDIATPLFGPIFRAQLDLLVKPLNWGEEKSSRDGEWPSLTFTNWVLSRRFGERSRPYLAHIARVLPVSTMREAIDIWPAEFAQSGATRFRGKGPELTLTFLTTYYHIEKHREALLYSFIVLACDADLDGRLSHTERDRLVAGFGPLSSTDNTISVSPTYRPLPSLTSLANELNVPGVFEAPLETEYGWPSTEGYPLAETDAAVPQGNGEGGRKKQPPKPEPLTIEVCVGSGFGSVFEDVRSIDVFRRIAFKVPRCGDLLIVSLVGKSGPKGLRAFLPERTEDILDEGEEDAEEVPSIGRSGDWKTADFSVPDSARRDPRMWAVRAIQRYSYVLGDSATSFVPIHGAVDVVRRLKPLLNTTHPSVYAALNDDLKSEKAIVAAEQTMKEFFEARWGGRRGWWEKTS